MVNKVIAAAQVVFTYAAFVLAVIVCGIGVQLLHVQPTVLATLGVVTTIALFLAKFAERICSAVKR